MDICDNAEVLIEMERKSCIARDSKSNTLPAIGRCYNCNEDDQRIMAGRVFCCSECRDDYENRQAAKKRNGQ